MTALYQLLFSLNMRQILSGFSGGLVVQDWITKTDINNK
jgi:hypothetical protein